MQGILARLGQLQGRGKDYGNLVQVPDRLGFWRELEGFRCHIGELAERPLVQRDTCRLGRILQYANIGHARIRERTFQGGEGAQGLGIVGGAPQHTDLGGAEVLPAQYLIRPKDQPVQVQRVGEHLAHKLGAQALAGKGDLVSGGGAIGDGKQRATQHILAPLGIGARTKAKARLCLVVDKTPGPGSERIPLFYRQVPALRPCHDRSCPGQFLQTDRGLLQ